MTTSVSRFLRFQHDQGGILTPGLAENYLGISRQALAKLRRGKKIVHLKVDGRAHFGMKSLREYKELMVARDAITKAINKDVTP